MVLSLLKKVLLLACSVGLIAAGCGGDTDSESGKSRVIKKRGKHPYGDMLVYGTIGEPLNLIPVLATDSASHDVTGLVYSGLISVDADLNLVGDLAKNWEISADNRIITFHLRKDVLWHDGVPFTAADVIFTYNFIVDPNTPTAYGDDFKHIQSVSAPDANTVVVEYAEAYAPALLSWGTAIMPKHLLENVPAAQSPLQRHPIGTGPFVFESWESYKSLTLAANPNYYDEGPYIGKIQFRFFQDQGPEFLELLNGSIDIMSLTPVQYTKQTDNERFAQLYNKYDYPSLSYSYIGYNLNRVPFNDKEVRQALSYATPKQEIIDNVLQGLGHPIDNPYMPGSVWYNDKVAKYGYDLGKAEQLLNDAGWVKNAEGMLIKNGKPFKITLITNQNTTRSQILEIVQQSWAKLGIDVSIRVLEWGIFINEYINKRNFDAVMLAWTMGIDPNPIPIWHSRSTENATPLNYIGFKNADADSLMDKGLAIFDIKERKKYYDRFQDILAEEQPYTFLYAPQASVAVAKRFKGLQPAPAGLMYNINEWYVPKDEQKYKF